MMSKRINWIDFGKGLTILIVVLGHVIIGLLQSNNFSGIQNKFLLYVTEMIYVFHMPVFFALSGYFFKYYHTFSTYLSSMKVKFISLGIPYITFSIVLWLMKKVGSGSVREKLSIMDLVNIYKAPIGHLWFLYVLFGLFLYGGLLSLIIKNSNQLLFIGLVGYIIINFFPSPFYFINRILVWFPIFILGAVLKEFKLNRIIIVWSGILYIAYIVVWIVTKQSGRISYERPALWGIILPISIILAFSTFSNMKDSKFYRYFVHVGENSLSIYLIHVPVVSVTRIVLFKLGINNLFIHIIIGLLVGWFVSIGIYQVIKRVKYFNFFLFPYQYIKKS